MAEKPKRTSRAEPEAPDARAVALDLVGAVLRKGLPLDDALEAHRGLAALEARDRGFARLIAATVLRRLGQIDAMIAACLDRGLPKNGAVIEDILRLGVAQLVFLDTPAHAAVDTAVRLAVQRRAGGLRGLINAVLRRLARDGKAMADAQDAARLNTPDWLWQSWAAAYGEDSCRAIAAAHLTEAPLDITAKGAPEDWAGPLEAAILPTGTLRRTAGGPVTQLPGFEDGAWWVQDAAASLPARLLISALGGDVAGKAIADLCAAPGGKTAQLAAAGTRVTAVDASARRLARVADNLKRLGLEAALVEGDAAEWAPPLPLAGVLLDAPCSGTGTIRRHPDIARLKSRTDPPRLAALQDRLSDAAAGMLAPGGVLVYSVCSLEPVEGPDRVAALLARRGDLVRQPIRADEIGGLAECLTADGDLRTLPCHLAEAGGLDGFYAARLVRR